MQNNEIALEVKSCLVLKIHFFRGLFTANTANRVTSFQIQKI